MILAFALACAVPLAATHAEPLAPPPMPPPPPPAPPGSLWSDNDTRALVGMDNNARQVGDQITVKVAQTTAASNGADTALARDGSAAFGVTGLLGAETSILKANPNMNGSIGLGGTSSSATTGKGATSRTNSVNATVTCTVHDVYPNGNLHITGTSTTKVNNETQVVYVEGTARARDIRLDNTIDFSLLADAKVEVSGQGAVTNQQGQGWGTAIANAVWPF
jgi:flagellar L-ring protein precursor FlgH